MTTSADRFNTAVGAQLHAEMRVRGESIASVARQISLSRSALDNYVKGKREIPVTTAYRVCELLGLSPTLLVRRAEERFLTARADDEPALAASDDSQWQSRQESGLQ